MKRKILMFLSFIFAVITAMAVLAACGGGEEEKDSGAEAGTYYCDVDTSEYTLELGEGGKCVFTLKIAADTVKGRYDLDGETLSLVPDSGETIEATLKADTVRLVYKSVTYSFLKKIEYTVQFDTDGNGTIASATVINGKTVAKPQPDPVKSGATFIAWYTDAGFRSAYDFSQPVRSDLVLHARFIDAREPEYTVTFNVDGNTQTYSPVETTGGIVADANLPKPEKAGAEFAGWWVSHFEDADKLTYQYEEQILNENTTLFAVWKSAAPLVSITETGITWSSDAVNARTSLKFVGPDNETIYDDTRSTTSYPYTFADKAEGEYRAEVTVDGETTIAYYNNKALPRISHFHVEEGTNVLTWNTIEGAEKYLVSYTCDSGERHVHTDIERTQASFDFSGCVMPEDGFEFTVKAVKTGYVTSEATFTFDRTLAKDTGVTGLTVNADTGIVTWNAVPYATRYTIDIKQAGVSVTGFPQTVTATSFDTRALGKGDYVITVVAEADGWLASEPAQTDFNVARLATPTGIKLVGSTIQWTAVQGAHGYEVVFDGATYQVADGASFTLQDSYKKDGQTSYVFKVLAKDETAAGNSLYSDEFTVKTELGEVTYANGKATWDAVWGANEYTVTVSAGETTGTPVETSNNECEVTLVAEGVNTITVTAKKEGETIGSAKTTTVTAYAVHFDVNAGSTGHDYDVPDVLYKAYGDPIELEDATRSGYKFNGWYTAATDGTLYEANTFDKTAGFTLYARWSPEKITVSFVVAEEDGEPIEDYDIYYEQDFKLPVPEVKKDGWDFLGWYSQAAVGGIAQGDFFADGGGLSRIETYTYPADGTLKLYAYFSNLFTWTEVDGANAGWRVSKNPNWQTEITEITIPYLHANELVTEVSDFSNFTKLTTIRIPSTIKTIDLATASAAFRGCNALTTVEIYEVPQEYAPHIPVYFSHEGALYQDVDGVGLELVFVPKAVTGTLHVMEGTNIIVANAFKEIAGITEVTIPSSVTTVEGQAFDGCSQLQTIRFLEPAAGVRAQALSLRDGAFSNLTALQTIVLPARLADFSVLSISGCTGLTAVQIGDDNNSQATLGEYSTKGGLLYKGLSDGSELVYVPSSYAGTENALRIEGVTSIGAGAFGVVTDDQGAQSGTVNKGVKSVTISGQVTHIGRSAFRGASELVTLVFEGVPETVANNTALTIEEYAFYGLTALQGTENKDEATKTEYANVLELPANLQTMGAHAFGDTRKVTNVTVKSATTTVNFADGAFGTTADAYYVTKLTIGAKVPDFDIPAVFGLNLKSVEATGNTNFGSNGDGVLYDSKITTIRFYPKNKDDAYVTPATLREIPAGTFTGHEKIPSITIGKNVESIGERAFYGVKGLTAADSVTFEADGTAALIIGKEAFATSKITKIALPERTTEIGSSAFSSMTSLTSFSMPATAEKFGDELLMDATNVLGGDTALATITVTTGVADKPVNFSATSNVLYKNTDGKPSDLIFGAPACATANWTVTVPGSVTHIWKNAFKSNTKLKALNFAARDTDPTTSKAVKLEIMTSAFESCTGLNQTNISGSTLTLPDGTTKISERAFYRCSALKKISMPSSLELIDILSFTSCTNLQSVTFRGEKQDGELVIAGTGGIQTTVGGGYTTTTYYGVFQGCSNITSFDFPEGLISIGDKAFYQPEPDDYFTELHFPSTLVSIGASAFYEEWELETLEEVTFAPNGKLETIGAEAFENVKITSIDLPDTVTSIGNNAFFSTKLASFKMPAALEVLGTTGGAGSTQGGSNGVFRGVTTLKSVTFNDKIRTIGDGTFRGTKITAAEIPASVQLLGVNAFASNTELQSVTFKNGFNGKISDYAFYGDTKLKTVTFEEGTNVSTIGASAFQGCTALAAIQIPASVETIGNSAFDGCTALANVTWQEGVTTKLTQVGTSATGSYVFRNTAIEQFALPASENGITLNGAIFDGCTKLTKLTLSKDVVAMNGTFAGCTSIRDIEVAAENESFSAKEGVLYDYEERTVYYIFGELKDNFVLDPNATEVAYGAFLNQSNLTEISIPATVKVIGARAFENCVNLETVTFAAESQLEEIGFGAFKNCVNLSSINFETTTKLKTLGDGSIYQGIFYNCTSLGVIDLSNNTTLTKLGNYMFRKSSVTEVKVPASLTNVGTYAFQSCTELTKVDFSACTKLGTLGDYAFDGCSSLNDVKFCSDPAVVLPLRTIGKYAFQNCTDLATIALPNTVTTIDTYAFLGCTSLGTIKLPNNLTAINQQAFQNCTNLDLDENNLPVGVTTIGTSAFENTKLTKVTIPAGLTSGLGGKAFMNCASLATLTFAAGSKCTTIGANAFNGTAIQSVEIPNTVTTINDGAFANCTQLATLTFAAGGATSAKILIKGMSNSALADPATSSTLGAFQNTALSKVDFSTVGGKFYIAGSVFACNPSLNTIVWGTNKIEYIGSYAFAKTGFTSIELPANTKFRAGTSTSLSTTTDYAIGVFYGCENLNTVTFAEEFVDTALGDYFFYQCTNLQTVNFTNAASLRAIKQYAFAGCSQLQKVDLSPLTALTSFGGTVGKGGSGTTAPSITLPALNTAACPVFGDCTALQEVVLPTGFTHIGSSVFMGCTNLQKVTGFDSLVFIGNYAFANTKIRTNTQEGEAEQPATLKLPASLTTIGDYAFMGTDITSVNFSESPEDLTSIASGLFSECEALASVTLSEHITTIGANAFFGCSALTQNGITLTAVTEIGDYSFANTGFTAFDFTANTALTKLSVTAFDGCEMSYTQDAERFAVADGFVLDETTKTVIGVLATAKDEAGTITVPTGYKLSAYLFKGIEADKLVIPESVTELPGYVFYQSSIGQIEIQGSGLTKINGYAFEEATFTEFTVPAGVSVESYAFYKTNVQTVTVNGTFASNSTNVFEGSAVQTVTLPADLTAIGNYWFRGTTALTTVNIPETVTKIGLAAFDSSSVTTLTIPKGVTTIGSSNANQRAFEGSSLQTVTIQGASVPQYAFWNAAELETVNIVPAEGVTFTTVGLQAFQGTAITAIELPATTTVLNNSAFKDTKLATITMKGQDTLEGLTEIGTSCFAGTSLSKFVIPVSLTTIGANAFEGCSSLTSVEFAGSYEKALPGSLFLDCESLSDFELPTGVTSIGDKAFQGCTSLTILWIPQTVKTISSGAFYGWGAGQTIYLEIGCYQALTSLGTEWWMSDSNVNNANVKFGYTYDEYLAKVAPGD